MRVVAVLERRIRHAAPCLTLDEVAQAVRTACANITVMECRSSFQLLATLLGLLPSPFSSAPQPPPPPPPAAPPPPLSSAPPLPKQSEHSCPQPRPPFSPLVSPTIRLLVLESIGALYWLDKNEDRARSIFCIHIVNALKRLASEQHLVIVVTKSEVFRSRPFHSSAHDSSTGDDDHHHHHQSHHAATGSSSKRARVDSGPPPADFHTPFPHNQNHNTDYLHKQQQLQHNYQGHTTTPTRGGGGGGGGRGGGGGGSGGPPPRGLRQRDGGSPPASGGKQIGVREKYDFLGPTWANMVKVRVALSRVSESVDPWNDVFCARLDVVGRPHSTGQHLFRISHSGIVSVPDS
eukprot:gnl/Spiro4/28224_TR13967_c0_g1_i1.p1 gnl/Spiro4/28224_TR13967_c0_g1~~gnl/Spiro4/28224_TR13967_c0_g1_i1.p1  ORF type:complete len:348 (+),score=67.86 gnl/Spiro4/28224_TR13967_c0_g1_i1:291-1334(+)